MMTSQMSRRRRSFLAYLVSVAVIPLQGCIDTISRDESEPEAEILLNNLTRERIAGKFIVRDEDDSILFEDELYIKPGNHHHSAQFRDAATVVEYEIVETTIEDPEPNRGTVKIPAEPDENVPDRDVRRITLNYPSDGELTYMEF